MRELPDLVRRLDPEAVVREGLGLAAMLTGILFWLFLPGFG
jgi:hypothetical protein